MFVVTLIYQTWDTADGLPGFVAIILTVMGIFPHIRTWDLPLHLRIFTADGQQENIPKLIGQRRVGGRPMAVTAHLVRYSKPSPHGSVMKLSLDPRPRGSIADCEALLHILSATTMLFESNLPLKVSDRFDVNLDEETTATVIWISGRLAIGHFDRPVNTKTLSIEKLMSVTGPELPGCPAASDCHVSLADDLTGFGPRMHRLRLERGFKQGDIAERLKVSIAAVSQWESGKALPRGVRWSELADFLGVSVEELSGNRVSRDLLTIVSSSRVEIARAAGTSPEKVHISVDL